MTFGLAIYAARHGLSWCSLPKGMPELEIDCSRTMFGKLPDFDAGDNGFEGISICGGRAFIASCFKARKWDFMGRDSLYMAVTWMPVEMLNRLNVDALFALKYFREPMRNPPTQFEFAGIGEGLKDIAGQEVVDGLVLRRKIGERDFVSMNFRCEDEPSECPAQGEAMGLPAKAVGKRSRKWKIVLWWALACILILAAVVVFVCDVLNRLIG